MTGTPAEDGAGVSDYDFILYITAVQSACPESSGNAQTVAIASSCQTEAVQDRPVAGHINFCPEGVRDRDSDFAFAVSKHEILHALGFSSFLFSLWRDENNMPRTERSPDTGLPDIGSDGLVWPCNCISPETGIVLNLQVFCDFTVNCRDGDLQ